MTRLRLPEDGRAAGLLARLDSAYFQFASGLPPTLRELASRKTTFTGTSPGEPFRGPSTMNPGVTCTPWLFWELTEGVADDRFVQVALGGTLIVLASVLLDHLVDGQAPHPHRTSLLHQALYEGGVARLRANLPAASGFWAHFERLSREHVAGLTAELDTQSNPDQLTFDRFLTMVPSKFSPIVITMAAFAGVLEEDGLLEPIETSIKDLAVASQLLDDMGDWKDDVDERHLTYYLTRLAPCEAWRAAEWPSVEQLQERIDEDWLDIKHMSLVQEWLDKAMADVRDLHCRGWMEYLKGYRTLADEHLKGYKARHLLRIIRPIIEAGEGPTEAPAEPS